MIRTFTHRSHQVRPDSSQRKWLNESRIWVSYDFHVRHCRTNFVGPATYDVTSQSLAVQSIRDAIMKKTMKGKEL